MAKSVGSVYINQNMTVGEQLIILIKIDFPSVMKNMGTPPQHHIIYKSYCLCGHDHFICYEGCGKHCNVYIAISTSPRDDLCEECAQGYNISDMPIYFAITDTYHWSESVVCNVMYEVYSLDVIHGYPYSSSTPAWQNQLAQFKLTKI